MLFREFRTRPEAGRTLSLLQQLSDCVRDPGDLWTYHELLLFGKAYPRTPEIRAFCDRELRGFYRRILALDEESRAELDQSGIVGTRISYAYDEPQARWLHRRLGRAIDVDWELYDEKDDDPIADILPFILEPALADASDDPELSSADLVNAWRGDRSALEWLLNGILRIPVPYRQHFYNNLALPLKLKLAVDGPSRTTLDDCEPDELFLWNPEEARRSFDLVSEVKRQITIPAPVNKERGRQLLDLALGTLLPRLRELYPATHGNPAEVYDIPLERGVRIIFWFMKPAMRLPLEAGWGILLLKNNVPIGYGAGGLMEDRSEIAINVFDTFRGGEAAWLYAQYARVLHALGAAPWLVTRKYQIGFENEEGLVSGAYWFYDKMGFRSIDPDIRKLADAERKKIARQNGYRTPRRILKSLCGADVVLSLEGRNPKEFVEFPLSAAGVSAGKVLPDPGGDSAGGIEDRVLAEMTRRFGVGYEGWSDTEKERFAQTSLFVLAVPETQKWGQEDRRNLLDLCRLKGSSCEADYARAYRKNRRFFAALRNCR